MLLTDANPSEALLAPGITPRVFDDPVVVAILLAPADDLDCVAVLEPRIIWR